MLSRGALGNDQCNGNLCPLNLKLKEGKGEVITAGHFNLLWTDSEETESSSSDDALDNAKTPVKKSPGSSVANSLFLDNNFHTATLLVLAKEPSFSDITHNITIHETQRSISLTGLNDGRYFARLFDEKNHPVSNPVEVTVKHHSMQRVWIIFISGAMLFLILIGYMVAKVFRHKEM